MALCSSRILSSQKAVAGTLWESALLVCGRCGDIAWLFQAVVSEDTRSLSASSGLGVGRAGGAAGTASQGRRLGFASSWGPGFSLDGAWCLPPHSRPEAPRRRQR